MYWSRYWNTKSCIVKEEEWLNSQVTSKLNTAPRELKLDTVDVEYMKNGLAEFESNPRTTRETAREEVPESTIVRILELPVWEQRPAKRRQFSQGLQAIGSTIALQGMISRRFCRLQKRYCRLQERYCILASLHHTCTGAAGPFYWGPTSTI